MNREEMLELAEAGFRHAEGLSAQLAKPDWKPSRSHVEQARNSIKKLAELLSAPAQRAPDAEIVRLTPYVEAFRREEARADKLGRELDDLRAAQRVTGASDIVDEAACLIWAELCPGMIMGDDDRQHYENAAKAVLSLTPTESLRLFEENERLRRKLEEIHDITQDTTLHVDCWQKLQNIAATSASALSLQDGKTS